MIKTYYLWKEKEENNNNLRGRSFHNYIKKNENEKCKIVLSMTFHRAIWMEVASLYVPQISSKRDK